MSVTSVGRDVFPRLTEVSGVALTAQWCLIAYVCVSFRDPTLSKGTSLTSRSILSDPKLSFFSHYQRVWKKKWGKNEGWIRLHAWIHWMIPSLTVQSKVWHCSNFCSRTITEFIYLSLIFFCERTFWKTASNGYELTFILRSQKPPPKNKQKKRTKPTLDFPDIFC